MRFELRHVRAFVVLAEELHFRKASERLFMTQPGLTRLVKYLEEEIGAPLFVRTTRSVALTSAGSEFLIAARNALKGLERGVARAHHAAAGDIGTLTLAYMDFAINGPLPGILDAFHRRCPQVHVELVYMPTASQKEALMAGHIDIGLMIGPFSSRFVRTLSVVREPLVALIPDRHPLAQAEAVTLADLADQPFVLGSQGGWSAFRASFFEKCHRVGFAPRIVQEASTSDAIFGLVAANTGVSVYTACAKNIQRRGVTIRPLADCDYSVETLAAWRADPVSPSADRFIHMLEELVERASPDSVGACGEDSE